MELEVKLLALLVLQRHRVDRKRVLLSLENCKHYVAACEDVDDDVDVRASPAGLEFWVAAVKRTGIPTILIKPAATGTS